MYGTVVSPLSLLLAFGLIAAGVAAGAGFKMMSKNEALGWFYLSGTLGFCTGSSIALLGAAATALGGLLGASLALGLSMLSQAIGRWQENAPYSTDFIEDRIANRAPTPVVHELVSMISMRPAVASHIGPAN